MLAELAGEQHDVTAQQLHERLRRRGERVGLATVYRTLGLLVENRVVESLQHRTGELCYRVCRTDGHHHHLLCSECHRVVELVDCNLDTWLERVSAEHGFVATEHHLEVTGVCADCRDAGGIIEG